ncbi:MAG: 3'(2'),5'-bisphosphate nucleotidase CysQ [Pseudomonadota bacterium]
MTLADTRTTYSEDLELITKIAIEAGGLALPYFHGDSELDIQLKEGNSPVSAADYAVNEYLEQHLKAARPKYGWLSEETNDLDIERRTNASRTFIVDPIDGTRGFIEGRNQWCVSVSVVENSRPIAGVLVCPARDEIYQASLGGGAFLNQQKIELNNSKPERLILGGPRVFLDAMDGNSDDVFERHLHVPSLAYRIALVATGRMTATFVKPNAHDWDIAAADLILHEAGGILCDQNGEKFQLNQQSPVKSIMFASHPSMLNEMLAIVRDTPFR